MKLLLNDRVAIIIFNPPTPKVLSNRSSKLISSVLLSVVISCICKYQYEMTHFVY